MRGGRSIAVDDSFTLRCAHVCLCVFVYTRPRPPRSTRDGTRRETVDIGDETAPRREDSRGRHDDRRRFLAERSAPDYSRDAPLPFPRVIYASRARISLMSEL